MALALAGTRVSLVVPAGFEPTDTFSGLVNDALEASIAVTELPLASAAVTAGWTDEAGAITRRTVAGLPARVLHSEADGDVGAISRVTVVFGTDRACVVVVATVPREGYAAMAAAFEAVLDSVQWDPNAPDPRLLHLPFELALVEPFAVAARMGNVVLLTEGGQLGLAGDAPMVTVGSLPLDATLYADDVVAMAEDHLQGLVGLSDVKVVTAGMRPPSPTEEGFVHEAVADAVLGNGSQVRVYQRFLVGPTYRLFVVGRVASGRFEALRPAFEVLADGVHPC